MKGYRTLEWREFRRIVIERDGGACTDCGKTEGEGAVLQVHHDVYVQGKLPWEYDVSFCRTLCRGCHAIDHLIIPPGSGWECVGSDDLGALDGFCEYCSTAIRYTFVVHHPKGWTLVVGTDCCDALTCDPAVLEKQRLFKRRERFQKSSRWMTFNDGSQFVIQKNFDLKVSPIDGAYVLCVDGAIGRQRYATANDAKAKAFDLIESGEMKSWLDKKTAKNRRR